MTPQEQAGKELEYHPNAKQFLQQDFSFDEYGHLEQIPSLERLSLLIGDYADLHLSDYKYALRAEIEKEIKENEKIKTMTTEQEALWNKCCEKVALKRGKDMKTLFLYSTHEVWIITKEAAELYAKEFARAKLDANNIAHKSATRSLVKQAIKLAQKGEAIYDELECKWHWSHHSYTEQEILEKIGLLEPPKQ